MAQDLTAVAIMSTVTYWSVSSQTNETFSKFGVGGRINAHQKAPHRHNGRPASAIPAGLIVIHSRNCAPNFRTLVAGRGVAVSRDGRLAVSASKDNTLKAWDLETGAVVATFCCDGPADCCAFASTRRSVAGDRGGRLYFLALEE